MQKVELSLVSPVSSMNYYAFIRTLVSSPLSLVMSFVPMLPVYVNFTLHMLNLCVYIYLFS